jgi:Bacterial type II and III secretion system protein
MRTSLALAAAAILMAHTPVRAQDSHGPAVYKVEFDIHDGSEAAGKVRHYTLLTAANQKATFKVGSRVPVATGSFQSGTGAASMTPVTQYTYVDVGVNIDCTIGEANGKLLMHGNVDISSIMKNEPALPSANPTVGQTKLVLDTAVDPGKPTVVASIDDPVTARQFRVQATVTRVN